MEKQSMWGPVTRLQRSTMQEDTVKECQDHLQGVSNGALFLLQCSYRHQTVGCWHLDTEGVTLQHQQYQKPGPLQAIWSAEVHTICKTTNAS